jgi:hypothetical protein
VNEDADPHLVETKDQSGEYVAQAQVRDNNSGEVLQLSGSFIAVSATK